MEKKKKLLGEKEFTGKIILKKIFKLKYLFKPENYHFIYNIKIKEIL